MGLLLCFMECESRFQHALQQQEVAEQICELLGEDSSDLREFIQCNRLLVDQLTLAWKHVDSPNRDDSPLILRDQLARSL